MSKVAVVTGAGSGVGRAVALRLLREGWGVALVGRREQPLRETAELARGASGRTLVTPCDISDPAGVEAMARRVDQELGAVSALVSAAGTNIPDRSLEHLSVEGFRQVLDINLVGTFNCVHSLLPGMRQRQAGTIVLIVSDAGILANAKAGAAYVASKFGERGLIQSINAEERSRGVRATGIYPGDINTPLLDKRPVPPPPEARERMLQPDDIADCVMLAVNLPPRAIVEELLIRPK